MASVLQKVNGLLHLSLATGTQVQQVRHRFVDWRMMKDYRRRKTIEQYGKERLRINGLRKNVVLPPELRTIADSEIAALPLDSSIVRMKARCVVTSRARGFVTDFRVSRIIFRHLADYNKLSGVQRAMW